MRSRPAGHDGAELGQAGQVVLEASERDLPAPRSTLANAWQVRLGLNQ